MGIVFSVATISCYCVNRCTTNWNKSCKIFLWIESWFSLN